MYIIPCEYTLRSEVLRKLFNGEDFDLSKGIIIHHCYKICDNCYEKFKEEGKRCKLCPNIGDVNYTVYCKLMLNL